MSSVLLEGIYCSMTIDRRPGGIVLITIRGSDIGELGRAPFEVLETCPAPFHLFVDSRDTRGASVGVSAEWAAWMATHRDPLASVTMLTSSRLIKLTADFVRRFAGLGEIMHITSDATAFEAALAAGAA